MNCLGHNPNSRAAQNYSVVKDLGQTPYAMSTLEVLQSCPLQRKALLYSLGVNDDSSSSVIKFETIGIHHRLPYYMSLFIHVECLNMTVKCTMIDKGATVSVMSLSCWKGLGSPKFLNLLTCLLPLMVYHFGHTKLFLLLRSILEGRPS